MKRREFIKATAYTAGGLVVPAHVGAAVFVIVQSSSGSPQIDSLTKVTGDFNHGSTIRVTGSGFGSKPQAAPLFYDPCTAYSNGDVASANGYWVETLTGPNCDGTPLTIVPTFKDNATGGAPLHGAATTSLLQNQDHQRQAAAMVNIADVTTAPIGEAYVSYQLHQNLNKGNWADNTDPIPNTKIYFLYGDTSWQGTTGFDLLGINYPGTGGPQLQSVFGCPAQGAKDPDNLTGSSSDPNIGVDGSWARQEGYKKESDPGVQNGKLYMRINDQVYRTANATQRGDDRPAGGNEDVHYGLPNSPSWQDIAFPNGVTTLDSSCTAKQLDSFCFGVVDTPNSSTPNCDGTTEARRRNPDHRPTIYHISEMYADDTGARTELIPDAAIKETKAEGAQIRLIQIPTAWSNTSIDFTINKSRSYDNDVSGHYVAVWSYPDMEISNLVQLSTAV